MSLNGKWSHSARRRKQLMELIRELREDYNIGHRQVGTMLGYSERHIKRICQRNGIGRDPLKVPAALKAKIESFRCGDGMDRESSPPRLDYLSLLGGLGAGIARGAVACGVAAAGVAGPANPREGE